ncbi:protein POLLENLESS 3-like [Salvia hispanica]|uniref:protein POLLENLESS 3-like n=1 Tax=Salvia hispanica TaxID=49212 RepID=UPI0020099C87|nr:protein POLLENLESS 3-like [Salvia hispanica]
MAMSSSSCVDRHNNADSFHPRGFLTPPPTWKNSRLWPEMTRSEPQQKRDLFHVIHKIPAGDSPYVRAKHVQLVDKDPCRAISLFWQAINAGDRVDSALKDMAVVMKQLNRSDEAIEAIKSFRHLSPPDSQEALDNILVELYKQARRVEEEIELLQYKLKQLEEGMAFSGRKTKIARSQGKKKVLVTVQKEYSRLLGNLAWAYMQKKDFKSAEENYRKALSFDADKNKQCNLAVCLMHTNKLAEARFLLEGIPSENGAVDESHVKSMERASEILVEFESQHVTKQMEQWGGRFVSQRRSNDSNGTMSSLLPSSGDMSKGASTGFAYEKRANHYEPKVSLTQPRRCEGDGDQGKAVLVENVKGNYCRKLSFGSSPSSESVLSFASPDMLPQVLEDNGKVEDISVKNRAPEISRREQQHGKSWANVAEEIYQKTSSSDEFSVSAASVDQEGFSDENVYSNIISKARELMGAIELGEGYRTQPEKTTMSKNQPLRRSLCFDQNHNPDSPNVRCASPLTTKAGYLGFGNSQNRRRLQVFQDITAVPSH